MSSYETVFYWLGVVSTGLFTLLGMCVFSAWIMNAIWARFKDGKDLMNIMSTWRTYGDTE